MTKSKAKPKKEAHRVKYKVFKESSGTMGYWIIPAIAIILVGLIYIFLVLTSSASIGSPDSSSFKIEDPFSDTDVLEDRSRASQELNTDETSWGKDNPFAP